MSPRTRRRLFLAVPLVVLLCAGGVLLLARGEDLRSRAARIPVGMPRAQVESLLGPPVLILHRSSGRGEALVWVDQFWQVDVRTDSDDRVESVDWMPSDSFLRRTVGRLVPLPK